MWILAMKIPLINQFLQVKTFNNFMEKVLHIPSWKMGLSMMETKSQFQGHTALSASGLESSYQRYIYIYGMGQHVSDSTCIQKKTFLTFKLYIYVSVLIIRWIQKHKKKQMTISYLKCENVAYPYLSVMCPTSMLTSALLISFDKVSVALYSSRISSPFDFSFKAASTI